MTTENKGELLATIKELQGEILRLKKRKKYGLVWEDKPEEFDKKTKNAFPVLKAKGGKFKDVITDKDADHNILIEGDNYHSLSVLAYTHCEKIDVIYIDPPYNTGIKDFIYNDSFVDKEDSFRHSKWLSFMAKRLRIAKKLLKNDGVIFISIDDNEQSQLKLLCDEIFGESNLLEILHIQVRYASKSLNEKDDFQKLVEQVLIYSKNKKAFTPKKQSEEYSIKSFQYEIIEKSSGENLVMGGKDVKIFKPGEYTIIKHKEGCLNRLKATWASGSVLKGNTSGKFFHNHIESRKSIDGLGVLYKVFGIGVDGLGYRYFTGPKRENATKGQFYSGIPLIRKEEMENGGSQKEKPIVNFYDYSADFGNIRHEGGVGFRGGKKPIKLLKQLVNMHRDKNALVLDFFAGSGSTGHAVLDLNKDDEGGRKFILLTNNEGKKGDRIAEDKCYPRIKNIIQGYDKSEALGGNLKYLKTDFVSKDAVGMVTDEDRLRLTYEAGLLLALKENAFDEKKKTATYQIFSSAKKNVGVYFSENKKDLQNFLDDIEDGSKTVKAYIFSWDKGAYKNAFPEHETILFEDIPEPILEVYKQLV